jgi:uncharacterized protein (DUF305 family)
MMEGIDGGMMNGGGMMRRMMSGGHSDWIFVRIMIPHHQLAVETGEDALHRAEHHEKTLPRRFSRGSRPKSRR